MAKRRASHQRTGVTGRWRKSRSDKGTRKGTRPVPKR